MLDKKDNFHNNKNMLNSKTNQERFIIHKIVLESQNYIEALEKFQGKDLIDSAHEVKKRFGITDRDILKWMGWF